MLFHSLRAFLHSSVVDVLLPNTTFLYISSYFSPSRILNKPITKTVYILFAFIVLACGLFVLTGCLHLLEMLIKSFICLCLWLFTSLLLSSLLFSFLFSLTLAFNRLVCSSVQFECFLLLWLTFPFIGLCTLYSHLH